MTRFRPSALLNRMGPRWGDWTFPAAILMVPVASFLKYHDYPLWMPSAILTLAVAGLVGLAMSATIALRPSVMRPVMVGLLLLSFIDLQFNILALTEALYSSLFGGFAGSGWLAFAVMLVVPVTGSGLAVIGRDMLTRVLAVVSATVFVAAVILPQNAIAPTLRHSSESTAPDRAEEPHNPKSADELPVIVHLVLDEHIGIAGIPEAAEGAAETRRRMRDFYVDNGFALYGRAFSHYRLSVESLSTMFNGALEQDRTRYLLETESGHRLLENAWLEELARRGYAIRVYQTDHLDLCQTPAHAIEHCLTYPMFGLGAFSRVEVPLPVKIKFIYERLLRGTFAYRLISSRVRIQPSREPELAGASTWTWSWRPPSPAPIGALAVADRLAEDLLSARPGTVYLAHLLVTHRGFMLEPDCSVRPDPGAWFDHPYDHADGRRMSERARLVRYAAYFRQLECGRRRVAEILQSLDRSGLADTAMVIVQGDHGSRISVFPPLAERRDTLTEDDLRDLYSTLFAIRAPHLAAGYDDTVRSIQALFADLVLRRPLPREERIVFLRDADMIDRFRLEFHALDRDDHPRRSQPSE